MKIQEMKNVIEEYLHDSELAGANVLCIKEGEELFYLQEGWRDLEAKLPIERDTIFRLYSMSKPITSVAVMILMEQGKIDLLEPVSKYLPGFRNQTYHNGDKIEKVSWPMCIQDLLNMTGGLVYPGELNQTEQDTKIVFDKLTEGLTPDNQFNQYGTVEAMNELGTYPLAFEPGTRWNYSAGADVLGALVEVVSGMRFSEFLLTYIFEPLEMKDTGFYVPPEKQGRLAYTYEKSENGLIRYEDCHLAIQSRMTYPPAFESGGAGMCSTIDDYSHFGTMLLNGGIYKGKRILSEKTVEFMTHTHITKNQESSYNWDGLRGFTYGNLLRQLDKPQHCTRMCTQGEYGWDGWLGCFFMNVLEDNMTFLFMMQKKDCGTWALTRRLINLLYSEI